MDLGDGGKESELTATMSVMVLGQTSGGACTLGWWGWELLNLGRKVV